MSKRADRERAEAGTIFRDGKLVAADLHNEKADNARIMLKFFRTHRVMMQPGDAAAECPVCKTPKPACARRLNGKVQHLCRKCFFVWESPVEQYVLQEDDGEMG